METLSMSVWTIMMIFRFNSLLKAHIWNEPGFSKQWQIIQTELWMYLKCLNFIRFGSLLRRREQSQSLMEVHAAFCMIFFWWRQVVKQAYLIALHVFGLLQVFTWYWMSKISVNIPKNNHWVVWKRHLVPELLSIRRIPSSFHRANCLG